MQQYQFVIQAKQRPETLERLLRVIRHRGFTVQTLHSEMDGNQLTLKATVTSERAFSLLLNQLEKLPDVVAVEQG